MSSRGRASRGEGTLCPDPGAVPVEDEGDRGQNGSDASQKSGSILDAHAVEHLASEEGKGGAAEGSKECVSGNG